MKECVYCGSQFESIITNCPNCGSTEFVERLRPFVYTAVTNEQSDRGAQHPETKKGQRGGVWAAVLLIITILVIAVSRLEHDSSDVPASASVDTNEFTVEVDSSQDICEDATVYLYDIEPFTWENGGFRRESSGQDCLGNTYFDVITEHNSGNIFEDSGSSETYRTNGKYTTFQGVLFTPYEYRNKPDGCYLQVIGDGKQLYYTELYCAEDPIHFQIDISGVSKLTIELKGHTIDTGMNIALPYLADCCMTCD